MEFTQKYEVNGMTCGGCVNKVKTALLSLEDIKSVEISEEKKSALITSNHPIDLSVLQAVLPPKYLITIANQTPGKKSWFSTYKPVLLIFIYLLGLTGLYEVTIDHLDVFRWMRNFMGGFFLTFSFFKILNLKGFKESYAMYDIIAKKYSNWGYIYAFTELTLGLAFLLNIAPLYVNSVTLIIMSLSIIGVLQSVLNKEKIQCACLGDVFDLPMSTVTIIEDAIMIVMSFVMLLVNISSF